MALKDLDPGLKFLGGLTAFAFLMALLSDGDPDNDAWGGGAAEASGSQGSALRSDPDDPWTAGRGADDAGDAGGLPACTGAAPFGGAGGVVQLPVHGPVTPFASPACRLDGQHGSDATVRLVQAALERCNGQAVGVDGVYGAATAEAVRAVQARHGLAVDGVYGPETRRAMAWPALSGDGGEACVPGAGID